MISARHLKGKQTNKPNMLIVIEKMYSVIVLIGKFITVCTVGTKMEKLSTGHPLRGCKKYAVGLWLCPMQRGVENVFHKAHKSGQQQHYTNAFTAELPFVGSVVSGIY